MRSIPTFIRPFPAATRRPVYALLLAAISLLSACGGGSDDDDDDVVPVEPLTIVEANVDTEAAQIGGATSAVAYYQDAGGTQWVLYGMANRLAATRIGITAQAVSEIALPGAIRHITSVVHGDKPYALVSMGDKGLAVVDLGDPAAVNLLHVVNVNYEKTGLTYVDGGGNPVVDATVSGSAGSIADVVTDGTTLWIANESFGIHQTSLANLLPVPVTEADGTLKVDKEIWTLHYAGENPWGGPQTLKLHGGRLYAALGFLGVAAYTPVAPEDIADPASQITRDTGYNLYTDEGRSEDWFGARRLSQALQDPSWVDPVTGMPTWQQAQYEINEIWRNQAPCSKDWCTPWASFDRYGKYYYNARSLELADLPGGRTMAYVAYALGGLVAVDMTPGGAPAYAGYVPAVPAHGADEPTGQQARSIYPHFGSGMLKEAGVIDVRVVADATGGGYKAYYSDHFAGLVVVEGAENPAANWRNPGGPFNNDTNPEAFWPDYEFVTSYDMTPVPVGEESMPRFLTEPHLAPVLLATGEISGHGNALFLMPGMDPSTAGQVDIVQASGAGGLNFIDIKNLGAATDAERFEVPVNLVSTRATGAAEDGSPTQTIAVGHSEGVTVAGDFVYLADGPHGMTVWRIAANGLPMDEPALVANTLQSEYPTGDVLPTPHAFKIAFGSDASKAYVLSQSLGLRRVDISAVTSGNATTAAPALLQPLPSDIYEHSTEGDGNVAGLTSQDHAYGVAFHNNYAIVADGGNGLTVYDLSADPSAGTGSHVVANIGGTEKGKAPLGRSATVKLWTDPATGRIYAVVAAGSYGVSVVDMTDLLVRGIRPGMTLLKTFEPKKIEEEEGETHIGSADGKSVDVHIVNGHAYFSYDSFGLVAYRMSDLVQPVVEFQPVGQPAGACADVTDVTKLSTKQGRAVDCRPDAVGEFRLSAVPGYEDVDGGALYMTPQFFPANVPLRDGAGRIYLLDTPRLLFYVAYGAAGVVKLDWSNATLPTLLAVRDTVGTATATAIANGRVYVADGIGGMVVLK